MQYQHAENRNYEAFASGRVFYARPGQPAFPVRLASEIFQRARVYWLAGGGTGACRVFDPVCGGGYWLTVLAYLHRAQIDAVAACDIEIEALSLAERNLSLLHPDGLANRIRELEQHLADYGKASHRAALADARRFQRELGEQMQEHPIQVRVFHADATRSESLASGLGGESVDLVLADVPYGWHSRWQADQQADQITPLDQLLSALQPVLTSNTILAIASDKDQKVRHPAYTRLEQFNLGRRRVTILKTSGSDQWSK